jgi:hypothetical protein
LEFRRAGNLSAPDEERDLNQRRLRLRAYSPPPILTAKTMSSLSAGQRDFLRPVGLVPSCDFDDPERRSEIRLTTCVERSPESILCVDHSTKTETGRTTICSVKKRPASDAEFPAEAEVYCTFREFDRSMNGFRPTSKCFSKCLMLESPHRNIVEPTWGDELLSAGSGIQWGRGFGPSYQANAHAMLPIEFFRETSRASFLNFGRLGRSALTSRSGSPRVRRRDGIPVSRVAPYGYVLNNKSIHPFLMCCRETDSRECTERAPELLESGLDVTGLPVLRRV